MQLIADDVDFRAYMAEPEPEHRILRASDWKQDLIDQFYKPRTTPKLMMGWKKTQADFEFREGEVSLFAGINGHGKSMLHSQVSLDLMTQHQTVCMASLEMRPGKLMARMSRQAAGTRFPTVDFLRKFSEWTDDRLWIYDHFGSTNPRTMLAVIRYAAEKFKVQHFVVDNLMKVVAGEDDYNAQKDFVNSLAAVAKDTGVHVHLIAHMKKGKSENDVPGKFDVKGSGSITDIVDNVFVVWRNKGKEDQMRSGGDIDPNAPDAVLMLTKQRNADGESDEGSYGFFFDRDSNQYLEDRQAIPKLYRLESGVDIGEVEL